MTAISPASTRRAAIRSVYDAVRAPDWAATNLDGLADVLRDLSWLPEGPVELRWPAMPRLAAVDAAAIVQVLRAAQAETAHSARPVTVHLD